MKDFRVKYNANTNFRGNSFIMKFGKVGIVHRFLTFSDIYNISSDTMISSMR